MTRLIDADALTIAVFKKAIDDAFLNGNTDMHRLLIQVIAHQPTVDAEPVRHGKWIDEGQPDDFFPHRAWRCSECGEQVLEIGEPWYKYCPNCGAYMKGTEDD